MVLDPARLLRNVRRQALPSGEALLQRISDGGAVLLQILDMKLEPQPDPEKHGTVDVFSGWDPSPETQTPKADLVSMRATTFHIGGDSPTSGALLVSMIAVPKEHGGPGLFVSLGGSLSIARDSDTMKFRFDAGFPGAFDMFIPFGDAKLDFAVHAGDVNPFLKLTVANGDQGKPAFRIGEPAGTRLDVYQTEFGITVSKQTAAVHANFTNVGLVVAAGSAGGFLSEIVGDGARIRFSRRIHRRHGWRLSFGWRHERARDAADRQVDCRCAHGAQSRCRTRAVEHGRRSWTRDLGRVHG